MTQYIWSCNVRMVEATRNFSMNRNFDGFDEKVEKSTFLDFWILLPWSHFERRSSALGVWCGYCQFFQNSNDIAAKYTCGNFLNIFDIFETYTFRMKQIQNELNRRVSVASNARSFNCLRLFLASLRHLKVKMFWKTRQKRNILKSKLELVGVSFS